VEHTLKSVQHNPTKKATNEGKNFINRRSVLLAAVDYFAFKVGMQWAF